MLKFSAALLCAVTLFGQPLASLSLSGRRAPSFSLPDGSLRQHDILDYRGKWLLLDFMKTDCPHCKELSKKLEGVMGKYRGRVEVLGVVLPPDNQQTVARYIMETKDYVAHCFRFESGGDSLFQSDPDHGGLRCCRTCSPSDPNGMIVKGLRPSRRKSETPGFLYGRRLEQLLNKRSARRIASYAVLRVRRSAFGGYFERSELPTWKNCIARRARADLKRVQSLIAGSTIEERARFLQQHRTARRGVGRRSRGRAIPDSRQRRAADARHSEGQSTPLDYAVLMNRLEVVEILLAHEAAVNRPGLTPLHLAARRGEARIAQSLIAHGADVNARDDGGTTPIEEASWRGETAMVALLVDKGADVKSANPLNGVTPLHAAAVKGHIGVAKVLLAAGAKIDANDKDGATALDDALHYRQVPMVDLLIEKGAKLETSTARALHDSVMRGQADVVALLLDRMGPLGSTTLLHDAALKGHAQIVELLLAHKADVNARNAEGATALHDAALAGQCAVAEALLNHGAEIDARDGVTQATALGRAASWGRRDVVELLLARGANSSLKDLHRAENAAARPGGRQWPKRRSFSTLH